MRSTYAEHNKVLESGDTFWTVDCAQNHAADNTVKVTTVPLALAVDIILGLPLRPAVIRQHFVPKLLTLIIDIALLSLEVLASLLYDGSRDLSGDLVNLLTKISQIPALSRSI